MIKKFLIISLICLSFGCSFHSGYMMSSASLSTNNFAYVKREIKGTSTATYLLGIGGLNREALISDAKQDLMDNYPLKDNQAYVNITVNFKYTLFFFYMSNRCTITASVVQFNSIDK